MGYLSRQMAVSDCGILDHGELLITYNLQIMKHLLILLFTACTLLTYAQVPEGYPANYAKAPRFKALIYYTQHAEEAHVQFAEQATTFFKKLNYGAHHQRRTRCLRAIHGKRRRLGRFPRSCLQRQKHALALVRSISWWWGFLLQQLASPAGVGRSR